MSITAPPIDNGFAHVDGSLDGEVIDVNALYPDASPTDQINVYGNGGDDTIIGNGGFNYIRGGEGNDVIDGGGGNDSVAFALPEGTLGSLRIVAGTGLDVGKLIVELVNGATVERVFVVSFAADRTATVEGINSAAYLGTDTVSNVRALDFLVEGWTDPSQFTNIIVQGSTSDPDFLNGGNGSDAVFGGDGGDQLTGGGGADVLFGQGGNDPFIQGGGGNDYVSGGDGNDFVIGSGGNDQVFGGAGDDYVRGDAGDDIVDGGDGTDRTGYYHVNAALGGATVSLLLQGQWQNTSTAGNDFLTNIETLSGNPFNDTLTGDDNGNWLWGSSSLYELTLGSGIIQSTTNNDTISAGGGDDLVQVGAGNHVLDGGDGSDTLKYDENGQETVGASISLALQGQAQDTGVGSWTISGFENLDGSNADDELIGDGNANHLLGNGGNDAVYGGGGDDVVAGGDGNDFVAGNGGNDQVFGNAGDDYIRGHGGDDIVDGGDGTDRTGYYHVDAALGGATVSLLLQGQWQTTGSAGNDFLVSIESVSGTPFADTLTGDDNGNWLWGSTSLYDPGDGSGTIQSTTNNDVISAGGGDDIVQVGAGNHVLDGGAGSDWLGYNENGQETVGVTVSLALQGQAQDTGVGTWTISGFENLDGSNADDELIGDGNANILNGNGGNDELSGGGGEDVVSGGDGHDLILGQGGNDEVFGDAGDDYVRGNGGDDIVDGGAGHDRTGYFHSDAASGGATVSLLLQGQWQDTGVFGYDFLISIESVSGTPFADNLTGDDNGNWLWGSTSIYDPGAGTVQSTTNDDVISAGGGDDIVQVGAGNHLLDGGSGSDWLSYNENGQETVGVTVSLALQDQAQDTGVGSWTISGFENLTGSGASDHLTGDDDANILAGGDGAGNDTLIGGGGDDRLLGDGYAYRDSDGYSGPVTYGDDLGTIAGDDVLDGGAGNDTLIGGGGSDSLFGGEGDDSIDGGAGHDVSAFVLPAGTTGSLRLVAGPDGSRIVQLVQADDSFEDVFAIAPAGSGAASVTGLGSMAARGTDTISNVEDIHFYIDNWPEPTLPEQFVRLALTAVAGGLDETGFAHVEGSFNGEVIDVNALYPDALPTDRINVVGNGGDDTIIGNGCENAIEGSDGNDVIAGGGGHDILNGNDGNDLLDGGEGDDYMVGGAGDDVYVVDGPDAVVENADEGTDEIQTYVGWGAQDNVENIRALGTGDIFVGGNALDNVITGNSGNNYLVGQDGNDSIDGGGGHDIAAFVLPNGTVGSLRIVAGSDGSRIVQLVQADDSFEDVFVITPAGSGAASVTGLGSMAARGTDTISNVEDLHFYVDSWPEDIPEGQFVHLALAAVAGGFDGNGFAHVEGSLNGEYIDVNELYPDAQPSNTINVVGNDGDDTIIGHDGLNYIEGNDGNDTIYGNSDNDALIGGAGNDLLDGGEGGDYMEGGAGDDVYIVGDGPDGVVENADEGTDEIQTYIDWGAPDNVENIRALGDGGIFLGGNDLDNVITGNSGNNYLVGAGGNDSIDGGGGVHDVAAFVLPFGTTGSLRMVSGPDGSMLVQLVQDDSSFEDVFAITPAGTGAATVTGLGIAADRGTDTISNVEDLHFFVDNWPEPPSEDQFVHLALAMSADPINDGFAHVDGSVNGEVIDLNALYPEALPTDNINVYGNGGDDTIIGTGGFNYIRGGEGSDTIDGGGGNDSVAFVLPEGTVGAMRIVAGTGDDTGKLIVELVNGATVERIFIVSFAEDRTATVEGINSAAYLGTDTVSNVRALDFLVEGWTDPAQFTNINVREFTDGPDSVGTGPGNDAVFGGDGNDILNGGGGVDLVFGEGGDDIAVRGGGGNDYVSGGEGHDFVGGQDGDDIVVGGSGDDFVRGDLGNDVVDGGDGHDRTGYYAFDPALGGVTVSLLLQGQWQYTGFAGNDFLINIESVSGNPFADTLTGDDNGNWLWGSTSLYAPDEVTGTIQSTTNNDTISAGGGDDLVEVGAGNHLLDGGAGSDWLLYSENGLETVGATISLGLQGQAQDTGVGTWTISGFENLSGSRANDQLTGDDAANILAGNAGNDMLIGGGGDDQLLGDGGVFLDSDGYSGPVSHNDDLGVAGDDTLEGGLGNDTLVGGGGNDTASYANASGAVTVFLYNGSSGDGESTGADGEDFLSGIENLTGSAYNDILVGNSLNNVLVGGNGNDELRGRGGDDNLQAGDGNDFLNGGLGNDVIDGGAGVDRAAFYTDATTGVTVNLNLQGVAQDTGQGMDILNGIENVSGTVFGDTLIGDGGDNYLWGSVATNGSNVSALNNDVIDGGGGNDLLTVGIGNHSLTGGSGTDTVAFTENGGAESALTLSLDSQGSAQTSGNGSWTLTGIENLSGGLANDALTGDANANVLAGNVGDDTLVGGAGNDTLLGDGLVGVDGLGSGAITTYADAAVVDPTKVDGNDTLQGGLGDDLINGGGGNDVVDGGEGNDTMIGGAGDDSVDGGTGTSDVALYYLPQGTAGTYSIEAGTGADEGKMLVMLTDGGSSSVVAIVTQAGTVVTVAGVGAGSSIGTDTLSNVDRLAFATEPAEPGEIPAGAAVLDIASGVSTDGLLAGATVFMDSNGNGTWEEGEAKTVTAEDGTFAFLSVGSGPLVVVGGTNTDTGLPNQAVLIAPNGSSVVNPLTTLVQSIVASGPAGTTPEDAAAMLAESLGISGSVDLLNTDVFTAASEGDPDALDAQKVAAIIVSILVTANDAGGADAGAQVLENLAEMVLAAEEEEPPIDLTTPTVLEEALAGALDPAEIAAVVPALVETAEQISEAEDLEEISEVQAEALTSGNDLDNVLTGGAQDDELFGFGGNDVINGNDGDDSLDGGTGDDQLDGGEGSDTSLYNSATAGVTVNLATGVSSGAAGSDTLAGIENLVGSAFADKLTGDAANNVLTGGAGADRLDGGAGIDTADYSGSNAGVSINLASSKHTGGHANGDVLVSIENITGSAFDDKLIGSKDGNVLDGGAGRDNLNGGGGADQLWGGAGADVFAFKSASEISTSAGSDVIKDFAAGDLIDLSALDANALTTKQNEAFTFIGSGAFTGVAGQLRVQSDGNGGSLVMGDVNGDGRADFTLAVANIATLNAGDFFL